MCHKERHHCDVNSDPEFFARVLPPDHGPVDLEDADERGSSAAAGCAKTLVGPPRSVGSAEQPSPVELVDRSRERGLEHVHLG